MKKIFTFFFLIVLLLPLSLKAESFSYLSVENHYSFTIPQGWIEIPKSTIDEVMRQAASYTGGQFVDYRTGFQLESRESFQYPYFLVQEHQVNTPSYNQILSTFNSKEFSQAVDEKIEEYSELINNASLEAPFVDKKRNIVFMNLEMNVAGVGDIKGLMAMVLGKSSVTQLNFYALQTEYAQYQSTFNQIIDSFKYDAGYEYSEEKALQTSFSNIPSDNSPLFNGVARNALMGAVVGMSAAFIYGLFMRSKKKGDKK